MAPVTSTSVGVAPQIIDDPRLVELLEKLNRLHVDDPDDVPEKMGSQPPLDIDALVEELNKWPTWRFEEQADLYDWINALNAIDSSLSYFMRTYPALLLIAPSTKRRVGVKKEEAQTTTKQAESVVDVAAVPASVVKSVCVLLRFLSCLLGNAINKNVFNSAEELSDLLAASEDEVASLALEALCRLATPPSLHKQQSPEVHQHSSALHSSNSNAHKRLITLARGWGSRGSGLGLFACVTADDSEHGQGALPDEAGELTFEFYSALSGGELSTADAVTSENRLIRIHLSKQDIVADQIDTNETAIALGRESPTANDVAEFSKQKRRRTESTGSRCKGMETKSTHELYFRCLEQAGGRSCIPEDRLFPLLADVRLAKAFHSNQSRVPAVERRMRALSTILHSHPSQDIMSGYFHAQPELCIELIDLLRPTVSSASVSAAAARPKKGARKTNGSDLYAIAALAQSPVVPYSVRTAAVEALTALVARRDGSTGGLTGVARQASVLTELGVAKGQYLGLLPTLIRYSLASLSSFLSSDRGLGESAEDAVPSDMMDVDDDDSLSLEVGLAFLEATKPPAIPSQVQLERALEFIDTVLTLTSAVVSAPSGTAALTDCGLVPALLGTVATCSPRPPAASIINGSTSSPDAAMHSSCLLRFITAQAIQIVEGAIVTHSNALTAFHDLNGVDVLVSRLHKEIQEIRSDCASRGDTAMMDSVEPDSVQSKQNEDGEGRPKLTSSRRVLLFSVVNCLTVVFHQESTSSSPSAPSAGAQLRKPELTGALIDIIENVSSYGGVLAALTSSLLSDIMNSEPQVVHHVHNSGLASSFLKMLMGETGNSSNSVDRAPALPPVPELIMALPNVLSALALTEDGAKAVREADPFPALISVFHHPKYAMPKSRCLLNELTAIVGTGLDEIMRHVPSLRPQVMSAIVKAMCQVVSLGRDLVRMEEEETGRMEARAPNSHLEDRRTCLMQYALNFGQMLEQVLHNEDHCAPFVDVGGLDTILELFPLLMPTNSNFLAHVSCLSCPSICTLAHSTTEDSLMVAMKSIAVHYEAHKMLKKIITAVNEHFSVLEHSQKELRQEFPTSPAMSDSTDMDLYAVGVLRELPREQIYKVTQSVEFAKQTKALSKYLRNVVTMQWLTNLLSGVIRAACQRSQEVGAGWGRSERDWKKELSSPSFSQLVHRLSLFHQSAVLEACRVRGEADFDSNDKERLKAGSSHVRYRLRIVCQEGAVVRDGIEIDSCQSVGSMEMGEIVEAFDRCVNSSGVMRYRTRRGWISELTRGHGREPIAEVIRVWNDEGDRSPVAFVADPKSKRTECGVPGIANVSASILARLQDSYVDFFSSLSRLAIQGFRSLQGRSLKSHEGEIFSHLSSIIQMMSSNIDRSFNLGPIPAIVDSSSKPGKAEEPILVPDVISEAGVSMYLGCMLNHFHSCLFLERRERRMVNVPLLLLLMKSDVETKDSGDETILPFFGALRHIFRHSLTDLANRGSSFRSKRMEEIESKNGSQKLIEPRQIVGRSVAASLPPALNLLCRLMSGTLVASSPISTVIKTMNGNDLESLVGETSFSAIRALEMPGKATKDVRFESDRFVKALHCSISESVLELWADPRLISFPPHIMHPLASLVREIVTSLERASKPASSRPGEGSEPWDIFSRSASTHIRRQRLGGSSGDINEGDEGVDASQPFRFVREEQQFEPSEVAVSRLVEMGFDRDHALDALESTRTNRVEIATEYALAHGPPSPGTAQRRREAREGRRRQREEREARRARGSRTSDSTGPSEESSSAEAGEAASSQALSGGNEPQRDPMDIDEQSSTDAATKNAASKTKESESDNGVDTIETERAKLCLRSWIEQVSEVSFNILSFSFGRNGKNETLSLDDGKGTGDGEVEALVVVLSSFLLEICQRYPAEQSRKIVLQLLQRLKSHMHEATIGGVAKFSVIEGRETGFAALCHSAVLFMRALPRTRVIVLEQNLVNPLVSCIQSVSLQQESQKTCAGKSLDVKWPVWLAPSLLLLDVMAQPLAAFTNNHMDLEDEGKPNSPDSEIALVREEHKKQATALSESAQKIFSAVKHTNVGSDTEKKEENEGKKDVERQRPEAEGKEEEATDVKRGVVEKKDGEGVDLDSTTKSLSDASSPFSSVPPYFPLIPLETAETCMDLCLRLLGKGQSRSDPVKNYHPPPGVVHATLLLLSRVLRSPKLAYQCLRLGAAEVILSLPRDCRFTGNSGLVTVILRRLLEDESTLQAAMETEIRGTVSRLYRKQRRSTPLSEERPSVPCHAFIQAVTPLICRDPSTFLKAAASSLRIESGTGAVGSSSRQTKVILLSVDQRAQNVKALSEVLGQSSATNGGRTQMQRAGTGNSGKQKRGRSSHASKAPSHNLKSSKSKSPHPKRGSSSKKSKKEKTETGNTKKKYMVLNGTPANHVTSLLVSRMLTFHEESGSPPGETTSHVDLDDSMEPFGEATSFLWIADVLEILADLVLSVPACAAAIHRYRPCNTFLLSLRHALPGCPQPPKNVVSFLLHHLLPQDRWSFKNNQQTNETKDMISDSELRRRKDAYMKNRVSQTSARLLVALVARAGEGRRRVVADLAFALSGGRLGFGSSTPVATSKERRRKDGSELFALQSWGELCIGLAAPRSNGVNHDNDSSLSLEVVKSMLEFGMVHSLMYGIQRVKLQRPVAATVCASLLIPLEVFTRSSVTDAIQKMSEKEALDKKKTPNADDDGISSNVTKKKKSSETELSRVASQRSETAFADDAMLEDGFDAETAARTSRASRAQDLINDATYEGEIERMEEGSEEYETDDDDEMGDNDVGNSDDESDEEISSDDESDDTDDIDEAESVDSTDNDDEEESEDDISQDSSSDDLDDQNEDETDPGVHEENNNDFLDNNISLGDIFEEPGLGHSESDMEDGWTRIESSGFGGMLMGGRPSVRPGGVGNMSARTRGFIDAAEAMIGTLLRTGEIQGHALAEIEDTLGIRITQNRGGAELDRGDTGFGFPSGGRSGAIERPTSQRSRDGQLVGATPHVNQRNPPDIGYSALGGGAREISSMEYVFGGPSVSAASRNYDIVSPLDQVQAETYPIPSPTDSQLFPGGPAASTHARTRQSLHPLLGGVELPPVNSLVSDLLSHGARETYRGHVNTSRPVEWNSGASVSGGYLVSTSSGNVIRLNRNQSAAPMADNSFSQDRSGLIGWTDDGLPFDGAIGEFSDAFERALGESMSPVLAARESANAPVSNAETDESPQASPPTGVTSERPSATGRETGTDPSTEPNDSSAAGDSNNNSSTSTSAETSQIAPTSNVDESQQNANSGNEGNSTTSEGDGVASSLAAGLRLSPRSESSANSDRMSTGNVAAMPTDAQENTSRPVDIPEEQSEPLARQDAPGCDDVHPDTNTQGENSHLESDGDRNGSAGVDDGAGQVGNTASDSTDAEQRSTENQNEPNGNGLVCPPGMDPEVFNSLPIEMQQELVEQHRTATELAAQLDSSSGLDPEALAALPEDMRREVIEQEQEARRLREQPPADPSNAEEMDNANFVASLAPELREEILLTADETFLNSLPPNIIAEANVLRERASARSRRFHEDDQGARSSGRGNLSRGNSRSNENQGAGNAPDHSNNGGSMRRKQRSGKMRVECDRAQVVYLPSTGSKHLNPPFSKTDVKALVRLMYLLSPVRPQRLLQKVIQNLCSNSLLRGILSTCFVRLLNGDTDGAVATMDAVEKDYPENDEWRRRIDEEFSGSLEDFPPPILIGTAPEILDSAGFSPNVAMFRRRQGSSTAASIAASLPTSARGSSRDGYLPPVVATRLIDTLSYLAKSSSRFCLDVLTNEIVDMSGSEGHDTGSTCFDMLLDLLEKPLYSKSSSNLEQLLNLLESAVTPLSLLPKEGEDEQQISQKDQDAAAAAGKEWVEVPRIAVSPSRLQLLCSILRMESCRDSAFMKVNTIARRLCRVKANRGYILAELASVAQALGQDAIRDLRALNIRMNDAVALHQDRIPSIVAEVADNFEHASTPGRDLVGGRASTSVTLSTSSSELKLLRVLQTLHGLCIDSTQADQDGKKNAGCVIVTQELVELLHGINLDDLWKELTSCLKVVQVLEGVASVEEVEEKSSEQGENAMETDDGGSDENRPGGKKLQNSVAGLLTRFLPTIEAFFVTNASATRLSDSARMKDNDDAETEGESQRDSSARVLSPGSAFTGEIDVDSLVGGRSLVDFVGANRVLLNAIIRNNPGLLEKGLRAMVQVSRCRVFLDFDVKRQWFKTQVRRLRQHASRRHGSLRLSIRRKHVFQDAYDQLRIRNADEMRGRLHITFQNEEGVDAGGLSREFFGILAKEIFNPDYALFTSTEDGCTFQPNPSSGINPDHLSYFRFVGRIVGKAVADGFLLDAHFTRSLYKLMLGLKPTHHDMEAIDPDYYKNLQMILDYKLADIGLDLTFSTDDHSFGRSQIVDLIPDGRRIAVTEDTKAKYVSLVCEHRMTTSIESQIKAYLDGFYELVKPELIAIFTPKELELLISGLPDIDVHDLRRNTDYQGYKATDKEIGWFWNILFSLSRSDKAAFLQFVTGSSKVPLSGFSELQGMRGVQKFSIHKVGGSSGALMSAHTCFNSLDLPVYKSESEMREKLLYAISEGGGGFLFA